MGNLEGRKAGNGKMGVGGELWIGALPSVTWERVAAAKGGGCFAPAGAGVVLGMFRWLSPPANFCCSSGAGRSAIASKLGSERGLEGEEVARERHAVLTLLPGLDCF
jgi:hypothetical protein